MMAYCEFVCMINPKMRGPAFQWAKFPDWCERRAKSSVYMSFRAREWKKWSVGIKEVAGRSAKEAAGNILRDSGLLEWWPHPDATTAGT